MGLDIYCKVSKKRYHHSYSGLHSIRYLALLDCGYPETLCHDNNKNIYPICYVVPKDITAQELNSAMQAMQVSGYHYPNLMFHSDCEGNYTKNGKVFKTNQWWSGNSIGLLRELEQLKLSGGNRLEKLYPMRWDLFIEFYELVKDEVLNGKGNITFC